MKLDAIKERLNEHFNIITETAGVVTAKYSYVFGLSKNGDKERDTVLRIIPTAKIIDYGNHFSPSHHIVQNGSAQDSYIYVKFTVED
jgi:hypothetical protein